MTPLKPLRLHCETDALARLSLGLFVAVTAYPGAHDAPTGGSIWAASVSLLESRGYRVWLAPHPGYRIRRARWTMTSARRVQIFDHAAYRLLSRRFPVSLLRMWLETRTAGRTREAVRAAFGRHLVAVSKGAGRYLRTSITTDNLRAIERETRPVLHLAHAIQAELDAEAMSAWDWPALMLAPEPQDRLRRMVRNADTWRLALQRSAIGARDDAGSIRAAEQLRIEL